VCVCVHMRVRVARCAYDLNRILPNARRATCTGALGVLTFSLPPPPPSPPLPEEEGKDEATPMPDSYYNSYCNTHHNTHRNTHDTTHYSKHHNTHHTHTHTHTHSTPYPTLQIYIIKTVSLYTSCSHVLLHIEGTIWDYSALHGIYGSFENIGLC